MNTLSEYKEMKVNHQGSKGYKLQFNNLEFIVYSFRYTKTQSVWYIETEETSFFDNIEFKTKKEAIENILSYYKNNELERRNR